MWPRTPQSIERATTRARLYDFGPYPALMDGEDLIRGELWNFETGDMAVTLDVLDEIECFGKEEVDLYVRRVVAVQKESGESADAYAYFFANAENLANVPVVEANEDGVCHWHRYL